MKRNAVKAANIGSSEPSRNGSPKADAGPGHLHATAEAEDEVKRRLLLDVVVAKGAAVLELLAGEDETLLIRGDALLVLNLLLDVLDRIARLDVEGDRLAGQGLDEDLHATTEAEDEVKGALLLDVVVAKGAAPM